MASKFERVTVRDLVEGDHIVRGARLTRYDGESLRYRGNARVHRLLPDIDPHTVQVDDPNGRPHHHLGVSEVAAELGVSTGTVTKWISRYPPKTGLHPVPTPDVRIGETMGWAPGRVAEWREWRAGMPGRGAGGGRPRKAQPE